MHLKFVPILYLTIAFVSCDNEHYPQVYEIIEEIAPATENVGRTSRNLKENVEEHYRQPVFDYKSAAQQDRLKWRYTQQQQIDALNLSKRQDHVPATTNHNFRKGPPRYSENRDYPGKVHLENGKSQNQKNTGQNNRNVNNPPEVYERDNQESHQSLRRTNKSLKPENYLEQTPADLQASGSENYETINAEDRHDRVSLQTNFQPSGVYLNTDGRNRNQIPQYLGGFVQSQPDQHIAALNSLIGKPPTAQLHGLSQLLGNEETYRDYTPIAENQRDIPNRQNRPNIKIEPRPEQLRPEILEQLQNLQVPHRHQYPQPQPFQLAISPEALQIQTPPPPQPSAHIRPPSPQELYPSLQVASPILAQDGDIAKIQAQLDAAAEQHAQNALAKAQEEATKHVEAQHKAIAAAKAQAEAEAFAKAQAVAEKQAIIAQQQAQAQAKAQVQALAEAEAKAQAEAQAKAAAQAQAIAAANAQAKAQALAKAQIQIQKSQQDAQIAYNEIVHNSQTKGHVQGPNDVQHPLLLKGRPLTIIQAPTGFQSSLNQGHIQNKLVPQIHQQAYIKPDVPSFNQEQPHQINADVQKYFVQDENPALIHGPDGNDLSYAAKYAFGYRIRDFEHGNDFGHEESRDGENAKGHYHVLLPDGRIQNVEYFVDPTGYHAKVSYQDAKP